MKKRYIVAGFAAFMVLAVSAQLTAKEKPQKKQRSSQVTVTNDSIPPPPPPVPPLPPPPPPMALPGAPVPPEPLALPEELEIVDTEYEKFLQKNPSVKSLGWTMKHEVIVRLKSGATEKYNLSNDKSVKEAERRYGKLPPAPPPPPPAVDPPPPPPPPQVRPKTNL